MAATASLVSKSRALLPQIPSNNRTANAAATSIVVGLTLLLLLPSHVAEWTLIAGLVTFFAVTSMIDLRTRRLPNALAYPALLLAALAPLAIDSHLIDDAIIGGLAMLALMLAIALVGRGAMGMGDVKLAAVLGCVLGIRTALLGLMLGFGIGCIFALILVALRVRRLKDSLPLVPFLALGAILALLLQGSLYSN